MTPSEALAAWVDGRHVLIVDGDELRDVDRFELCTNGLMVLFHDGISTVRSWAPRYEYRVKDAIANSPTSSDSSPATVSPTNDLNTGYQAGQQDSEAWGLLRALVEKLETHRRLGMSAVISAEEHAALVALGKRGML